MDERKADKSGSWHDKSVDEREQYFLFIYYI